MTDRKSNALEGGGTALERLRALLEAERGFLADVLAPPSSEERGVFGPVLEAIDGRGATRGERALVMESVLEGYLLHYGDGRLVETADRDLRLLAGDYMYAIGLDRLARRGDLDAVCELADLISLSARIHSLETDGDPPTGKGSVVAALWALTTLALAGGGWAEQRRLKDSARTSVPSTDEMLSAAHARASELGVGPALERALIAFDGRTEAAGRTT